MITETLTLRFQDADQQRRFHERLNTPEPSVDDDAAMMARFQSRMVEIVERAVLDERERCAKVAEGFRVQAEDGHRDDRVAVMIAAVIRSVPTSAT